MGGDRDAKDVTAQAFDAYILASGLFLASAAPAKNCPLAPFRRGGLMWNGLHIPVTLCWWNFGVSRHLDWSSASCPRISAASACSRFPSLGGNYKEIWHDGRRGSRQKLCGTHKCFHVPPSALERYDLFLCVPKRRCLLRFLPLFHTSPLQGGWVGK